MIRSQKIKLILNNKQTSFIEKSFGVNRFTYNYILENFKNNKDSTFDLYKLKKEFNHNKKEKYPFTYEVSKYVSQEPFMDFKDTLNKYFERRKSKKHVELRYKSKKDIFQSFYIGGDQIKIVHKEDSDKDYLKLPKMTPIKLSENIRFIGHIVGLRIVRKFNKYYASISFNIPDIDKKEAISNEVIGIDLGIKNHITLSNGLLINYPLSINKVVKRIKIEQKKLSRKVHPRTKDDPKMFSSNYLKNKLKVDLLYERMKNIMVDYERKVAKILVSHYSFISMEDLNVINMKKDKYIARNLQHISFYRLKTFIEHKKDEYLSSLNIVDRFFPSSKRCSRCGDIKVNLSLTERIYKCEECGLIIDRDINAAINLKNNVGRVTSELKPLDLAILIKTFIRSHIDISKIEEGRQQKIYTW